MDDWEDDFGAGPSNVQGGVSDPLVNQEYARLEQRYHDAGYREGITDGKLSTLQAGFDCSFASSVPASRRLGQLRGRANALLSILTAQDSAQQTLSPLTDVARALVSDLSRVKRNDVLPVDMERIAHERDEHGEHAFQLDQNESREMEGLEDALENLGKKEEEGLREGRLLDALEERVCALEEQAGLAIE